MYTITITPIKRCELDEIKNLWITLEENSSQSIFLKWAWIGVWLQQIIQERKCYLIKAQDKHKLVQGLGIFTEKEQKRLAIFKTRQWYIHKTGIPKFDQSWIEYNDFLLNDSDPKTIRQAMWNEAFKCETYLVDEWVIGVAEQKIINDVKLQNNINANVYNSDTGYSISMDKIHLPQTFPEERSKSTFKAINRTKRLLAEQGNLSFAVITDIDKVFDVLTESNQWHILKWSDTKTPSGFCNPEFVSFHRQLIKTNSTLLIALYLDENLVGVNYYLVDDTSLYFYLSSLTPTQDNRIKLGFLLHRFAISYSISKGLKYYDFLAGDVPYKAKFSNESTIFSEVCFERKRFSYYLKRFYRSLRRLFN